MKIYEKVFKNHLSKFLKYALKIIVILLNPTLFVEKRLRNFYYYKILNSKFYYYCYIFLINLVNIKFLFQTIKFKILHKNYNNEKNIIDLNRDGYLITDSFKEKINASKVRSHLNDKISKTSFNKKNLSLKPITQVYKTEELLHDKTCFDFVTNKDLLNIVGNYLNNLPQIIHVQILHSSNIRNFDNSSQYFHLDHEDRKQVKLFLFLDDVDETNGPLMLFNKEHSQKIIKETNYRVNNIDKSSRRLTDDKTINNNLITCTGKKDTIVLVDTSNLLHCGSRNSAKPRTVLMVQYVSLYSSSGNKDIKDLDGRIDRRGYAKKLNYLFANNSEYRNNKKYFQLIL